MELLLIFLGLAPIEITKDTIEEPVNNYSFCEQFKPYKDTSYADCIKAESNTLKLTK